MTLMQTEIRHAPSFSVVRCALSPDEELNVEAGAMVAHSDGVDLRASMRGGVGKSLKRGLLGGESFFMSTFTAPDNGGWVDVAAKLPGDVVVLPVNPPKTWIIQRGNWLASDKSVTIDIKWAGFKSLIGGEGGFMAHASGSGTVVVGAYGAIERFVLGDGERVHIDTSHVVAFDQPVTYELVRAVKGKTIQSIKSGEGFLFTFTGPGTVYTQTRSEQQLSAWITTEVGSRK